MNKNVMIASAVAAFLAGASCGKAPESNTGSSQQEVKCEGVNECKGTSECASKDGNSCQGLNECKGQGWVTKESKEACESEGGKVLS